MEQHMAVRLITNDAIFIPGTILLSMLFLISHIVYHTNG